LTKKCSFNGCTNPFNSHGYCVSHLTQIKKNQKLRPLKKYGRTKCSVSKCNNFHSGNGFCKTHYDRWKKYGNPLYFPNPVEIRKKISETRKDFRHTDETKQRISKSLKGKPRLDLRGKKRSENTRRKISEANKGKKHSDETKRKNSEAHKGIKHTDETKRKISKIVKGRKHTDETKIKMSEIASGRIFTKSTRMKISKSVSKINMTPKRNKQLREQRANMVLPTKDTKPEKLLQKLLKNSGIQITKHKNFNLGFQWHQVDIFIEPNICVEIDGDFYHANPNPYVIPSRTSTIQSGIKDNQMIFKKTGKSIRERDRKQTEALIQQGNIVLRVWQSELEQNPEKFLKKILKLIKT
jgi:G:T-mismatch repair DNA endonuclease (very short patch repair protein)